MWIGRMATAGVTFVGRLGSYRYLDMDVTIGEALEAGDGMLKRIAGRRYSHLLCASVDRPLRGHLAALLVAPQSAFGALVIYP